MSNKHRQWAGALARDCGIQTMSQQTATRPASNPAPANGEYREKRRYRKHPDDELAAMRLEVHRGSKVAAVAAKYDVAASVVYKAVRLGEPRPERKPGESKQKYGSRVKAWMLRVDPEYRASIAKSQARGMRLSWRRRKRALEAVEPTPPPPPVNVEAIQPVAAVEPPWGFQPPVPVETPTPRPGFFRSIGMMLGLVR